MIDICLREDMNNCTETGQITLSISLLKKQAHYENILNHWFIDFNVHQNHLCMEIQMASPNTSC